MGPRCNILRELEFARDSSSLARLRNVDSPLCLKSCSCTPLMQAVRVIWPEPSHSAGSRRPNHGCSAYRPAAEHQRMALSARPRVESLRHRNLGSGLAPIRKIGSSTSRSRRCAEPRTAVRPRRAPTDTAERQPETVGATSTVTAARAAKSSLRSAAHIATPPPVHARLRPTPRRSRRRRCTPGDVWRAMERRPKPCTHPSVAADLSAPVRDQSGRETGQRLPGTRRRLSAAERVQSGRSAAMRAGWGIPSESGPRCVAIPSGGADESGGLSAPPE
jgi:hypothetical protein